MSGKWWPLPALEALKRARASIDKARKAKSERDVADHYHDAKKALDRVNDDETDAVALTEIIAAFQQLVDILVPWGEKLQERAEKCRKRAKTLRQYLDERRKEDPAAASPSLIKEGSSATVQMEDVHLNSLAVSVAAPANISGQLPPASPQVATSIPASAVILPSPLFFRKDLNPVAFTCLLPGPGEPFETTCQLAQGLALLQDSVQEDSLSPDTGKWRHNTLNNPKEMARLDIISFQIIKAFADSSMKDATSVVEVVHLAPVLNSDHFRSLLESFVSAVDQSRILHFDLLEGLAKVIQGAAPWPFGLGSPKITGTPSPGSNNSVISKVTQAAAPGSIDSDDLTRILGALRRQLQSTHSGSDRNRYHVLLAVSRVSDAMVDAHIGDVSRVDLHGPLTDLIQESESSKNPYLTFQAAYATQALLNVSDDDDIWHAGFRRAWLVLKGGAGFANVPDPKGALESLEILYEAGKGGFKLLKKSLEAIKGRECPTFSVKDGLQFKKAWYRALRTAESYIELGRLTLFKELVTKAPCRDQFMFQWGICQLLGLFAADASQWGDEARQDAIAFLEALYKETGLWNRQQGVDQVIFDVLTNVTSGNDTYLEAAKSLLADIRGQNPILKPMIDLQSPLWRNIRPVDPAGRTVAHVTLLKVVQDQIRRDAKVENLPGPSPETGLDAIHAALKTYHARDLTILRVSGDKLNLETCFVNLAIVEAPAQREKEKEDLKEQAAVFHRIPSSERVENTDTQALIPLEQLFNKRKLRDGSVNPPKRILVQGRAGIGKTTLCKKLVHAHQNRMWRDAFDTVLRIPLRQLRGFKGSSMELLFREKVFFAQDSVKEQEDLAKALVAHAKKGKVLFILDGLDEIIVDTEGDDRLDFRSLLATLIGQQHVIVTTRPSGSDSELLQQIDLELETVGFSQQNVDDFLVNVLKPDAVNTVQEFIRRTPLIQGLVNIPVQLDVICFSWDSLPRDGLGISMTGLYQLMVQKLWCKDALRLKKKTGNGKDLMERHVHTYSAEQINKLMSMEVQHLGYLAFKGMNNKHQIEFDKNDLLSAFVDLEDEVAENQRLSPQESVDLLKETSFLHTADVDLDSRGGNYQQAWHFLHLTFQEYFAATWIVRHFHHKKPRSTAGMMTEDEMKAYVHQHKYNPQFEIVWTMVAGLLDGRPLMDFFDLLQGAPRDLIGGRHQQILSSCLNEARTRLDQTVAERLDAELRKWLHFEMQSSQHNRYISTALGSQLSFPEHYLFEVLGSVPSWKLALVRTLDTRSVISDAAIPFLVSALEEEDEDARYLAASALGKNSALPESAIQALLTTLKVNDGYVRFSATRALSNQVLLLESAIQPLTDALKNGYWEVRQLAARALGRQPSLPQSAIQSLIESLKDGDDDVRLSAKLALGNHSMLPESTAELYIVAHTNEVENVGPSAVSALSSLSTLSESSTQPCIIAHKDKVEDIRPSTASALGQQIVLSESAAKSLTTALKDDGEDAISAAARTLGEQSSLPESDIPPLIEALKDENESVRITAAEALGEQSSLPESAISALIDVLQDEDESVRFSAAEALGKQSSLPESAISALIEALKDEDESVRFSAAESLGKQSSLPEPAISALIEALKDEDESGRFTAAESLGKQSSLPESAIPPLIEALKDENESVRFSAQLTLAKQSSLSESTIRFLIAVLKDEHEGVNSSTVRALCEQSLSPESAVQPLVPSLKDKDKTLKRNILGILWNQCYSLCTVLPCLTKDEISCVYETHLFGYSCSRVLYLRVQDGMLCLYTEQGMLDLGAVDSDFGEAMTSAITTVQHKAGLKL